MGLGYPITGVLDETLGLHATFWFGTVVAGVALALSVVVLPRKTLAQRQPLDTWGAFLLGLALIGILVAVTEGQPLGWTSPRVIALFLVGAMGLLAWIGPRASHAIPAGGAAAAAASRRADDQLRRPAHRHEPLRCPCWPTSSKHPIGRIRVAGASVIVVGLMLLPFSILTTSMSRVSAAFGRRFGAEKIVPVGAVFVVVAAGLFSVANTKLWEAFLVMGIAGIGIGFSYAAMPGLIVRSVRRRRPAVPSASIRWLATWALLSGVPCRRACWPPSRPPGRPYRSGPGSPSPWGWLRA